MRSLVRPTRGKVLAGVCAAIADRLGLPRWIIRLLWIVLSFIPGPLWVLYVVFWVIIPAEGAPVRR